MKTVNGQIIKLKRENLGPDPEKALKTIVWLPSIVPIILIICPLFLLSLQYPVPYASYALAGVCVFMFAGMAVYFSGLVTAEDPTLQHKGALLFGHFRLFFVSAILLFLAAGLTPALLAVVVLLWLYSEFRHFSILRRVTEQDIFAAYPVRFSESDQGNLIYDSKVKVDGVVTGPWYYSKTAEAVLIPFVIIVGGLLFVRSFTLRDDFEPRFMIAGGFFLFVACILRPFVTRVALDIRAVKLKAQGKF